mmetsp:Transcript_7473/g.23614  ORF Transcript_7473/g.23614 Transcript_7473/m.23614 type:complete len:246 (+) Transcript_7473:1270-2007(+)
MCLRWSGGVRVLWIDYNVIYQPLGAHDAVPAPRRDQQPPSVVDGEDHVEYDRLHFAAFVMEALCAEVELCWHRDEGDAVEDRREDKHAPDHAEHRVRVPVQHHRHPFGEVHAYFWEPVRGGEANVVPLKVGCISMSTKRIEVKLDLAPEHVLHSPHRSAKDSDVHALVLLGVKVELLHAVVDSPQDEHVEVEVLGRQEGYAVPGRLVGVVSVLETHGAGRIVLCHRHVWRLPAGQYGPFRGRHHG